MNQQQACKSLEEYISTANQEGGIFHTLQSVKMSLLTAINNNEIDDEVINMCIKYSTQIRELFELRENMSTHWSKEISHDLANSMVPPSCLISYLKDERNIRELQKDDVEFLGIAFPALEYTLLYFQSLCVHIMDPDKVPEFTSIYQDEYSLGDLMLLVDKGISDNISKNITLNIDEDISMQGLRGDMMIFLKNILENSRSRGKADDIQVYIEEDEGQKYLCIADNGTGIDTGVFPDMNQIFDYQSTSGGTGIGLRHLDKRNILCSVSNKGLSSKYDSLDEVLQINPNFKGEYNPYGALFRVKI